MLRAATSDQLCNPCSSFVLLGARNGDGTTQPDGNAEGRSGRASAAPIALRQSWTQGPDSASASAGLAPQRLGGARKDCLHVLQHDGFGQHVIEASSGIRLSLVGEHACGEGD